MDLIRNGISETKNEKKKMRRKKIVAKLNVCSVGGFSRFKIANDSFLGSHFDIESAKA